MQTLPNQRLYRAESIGSMLRPDRLRKARDEREAGRLDPAEFKRIEDEAVDEAVAMQHRAGLDVVTDGEMRRGHFTGSLSEAVDGLGPTESGAIQWHGDATGEEMAHSYRVSVTGKLSRARSLAQEEFVYLRARTSTPVKVTLPSPLMMHIFWSPAASVAAYRDPFAMFADAAAILRQEVQDLVSLGCRYVQIDAPELAILVDRSVRDGFRARGIDPERMLTEGLDIIDSVTDGVDAHFGIHLCRGNRDGHWMAAGGYEAISAAVFRRASGFGSYLLEYDDARSGGFEPLADLAPDKRVVLGLVTTKRAELERQDALLSRVEDAARHFPLEQLAVSPQCGFATSIGGNPVSIEVQEEKFRLVRQVASAVWG